MLKPTARWRAFEIDDERAVWSDTYEDAVRRYSALWAYARSVNPAVGDDWEHDVAADVAVARAVNGLSPG